MTATFLKPQGLRYGPLSPQTLHVCVDMQRLFAEDTEWKTPWMARVLPRVVQLVAARPVDAVFTRFIPAERPAAGDGVWERYWRRWANMTLERLGAGLIDLVPELGQFAPPAPVIDKRVYSPWIESDLQRELKRRGTDTLIITGGETDVCVLATVLGAVDRGYRVIVVTDALCSSSDEAHDALMTLYANRYDQQVETINTDDVCAAWAKAAPSDINPS
jgi:nicotinamidase-related amidase